MNEIDLTGFEDVLVHLFGDEIKKDEKFAKRIYAALTNILWRKGDDEYGVTFRYAAGLIADIRQDGTGYMDWYCSAGEGVVDKGIQDALALYGWTPHEYDLPDSVITLDEFIEKHT